MTIPHQKNPSRLKSALKKSWPFALAVVFGIGVGAVAVNGPPVSSVGAEPEPEVITEEVTVEVFDPTCQAVSEELFSIIEVYTEKVSIPYSDVVITLIDQLQYGADAATLDRLSGDLNGVTSEVESITERIQAISPDYTICKAGGE
ncbi:MAG: hypothetical protein ACTH7X_08755 [Brevibacterium aurantiacum]